MFGNLMPPSPEGIEMKDYYTKAADGHQILLRWYTKSGSNADSAVVYTHGGGMFAGSVDLYDSMVGRYVHLSGVPFLSVDYRLAPEHPAPTLVNDAYAGLVWLHEHAKELGVDPKKIAIMGDSGGGAVAAGLTHLAKEKGGPGIAKQILIYPMLDDRNIKEDVHLQPFAIWSHVDNETAWNCVLGARRGKDGVSPKDAPARMTDASGLPPMYIETGELDFFRDEDVEYAAKFSKAGISIEMHIHPGCPHAFEVFAQDSSVAHRALADRVRVIQSIEPLESKL